MICLVKIIRVNRFATFVDGLRAEPSEAWRAGPTWSGGRDEEPLMSMWLSAANKAAGPVRGFWTAEAKRRQAALVKEAAKAAGLGAPAKKRSAAKRRAK